MSTLTGLPEDFPSQVLDEMLRKTTTIQWSDQPTAFLVVAMLRMSLHSLSRFKQRQVTDIRAGNIDTLNINFTNAAGETRSCQVALVDLASYAQQLKEEQ